ncbi:mucin-3B-like [Haliotis asinina]|uniref:mucin-3B-like n=1 Tax=Haliotis asinina TaxID=109174 RepID=UPI0035320525
MAIPLILVFLLPALEVSIAACPPDPWSERGGYCYATYYTYKTFYDAQKSCLSEGAHLTSVQSREELTLITALASGELDNNFWVGLQKVDGAYKWTDGSPLITWANMPVKLTHGFNCGAVAADWLVTRPCYYSYYYICKKLPVPATTTTTTTTRPTTTTTPTTTTSSTTTTTTTTPTTTTTTTTTTRPTTTTAPTTTTSTTSTTTTTTTTRPTTSTTTKTTTTPTTTPTTTTTTTTTSRKPSPTTATLITTTASVLKTTLIVRKNSDTESVPDNRPSAVAIGAFGIFILAAILVTIFLLDIGTFVKHFRWMRRNIRSFCRRRREDRKVIVDSDDDKL